MQNAADKMARELLGMVTNPNVSDSVKLAAIKDALDRAGLKPITTVDLEVSTKPWESVFEGISQIIAGPRDPENEDALAIESDYPASESESEDSEIVGEIDDDVIEDDLPRFQLDSDSESDVVDVEIVADEYTDEPGVVTPDDSDSSPSGPLSPPIPGGGLLSLSDAVEAAAYMRSRPSCAYA